MYSPGLIYSYSNCWNPIFKMLHSILGSVTFGFLLDVVHLVTAINNNIIIIIISIYLVKCYI